MQLLQVLTTLDVTEEAVEYAIEQNCNLIVAITDDL